jgi:hypothetical protein
MGFQDYVLLVNKGVDINLIFSYPRLILHWPEQRRFLLHWVLTLLLEWMPLVLLVVYRLHGILRRFMSVFITFIPVV